jgi:hypothetical protein
LGDSRSGFSAFRNSAIARYPFDLRMRQNRVPDRDDCCVCLCEHQVGENHIQETGSDLFLGSLVFMENHSLDVPRNWCLWYAFLGKINSHKKKSKICPGNDSEGPMVRTFNPAAELHTVWQGDPHNG